MGENAKPRELYVYSLPESVQQTTGNKEVALVLLNGNEERNATRRAGTDPVSLVHNLAMESLRQLDGTEVRTHNGTTEKAWNAMHPQLRNLIVGAYNDLHNPNEVATQAFLASRTVRVDG